MKVRVRQEVGEGKFGFAEHARRRPGDVFSVPDQPRRALFPGEKSLVDGNDEAKAAYNAIKDKDGNIPSAFSFRWMEPVSSNVPDRVTTAQQAVAEKSGQIKQERAAERAPDAAEGQSQDVL